MSDPRPATRSGRIPPNDEFAEDAVLGSLLLGGAVVMNDLATFLRPDHFYHQPKGTIYAAMQELYAKSIPIDIVTVGAALEAMGALAQTGGSSRLAQLEQAVPTTANAVHYARIVKQAAVKRLGIKIAQDLLAEGFDPQVEADDFVTRAQTRFFSLALADSKEGFERVGEGQLGSMLDRIQSATQNGVAGLLTGFKDVDRILRGLRNSELVIVAGKTSMGKTSLVLNIAVSALRQDPPRPVAMFSLEMSKENLTERLVAQVAQVDSTKLRDGGLDPIEYDKITRAVTEMYEWPVFIDADPMLDAMGMLAKARQLHQQQTANGNGGLGLCIVDYVQLMSADGGKDANRTQEVGQIAKACRAVARELDIPVLAVSQLSRANDKREDKRPILSDLRDSGELEQIADVVLFVHRPEAYKPEEKPGIAEILIRKNRNGPTGEVDLYFKKHLTQFGDMTYRHTREGVS